MQQIENNVLQINLFKLDKILATMFIKIIIFSYVLKPRPLFIFKFMFSIIFLTFSLRSILIYAKNK